MLKHTIRSFPSFRQKTWGRCFQWNHTQSCRWSVYWISGALAAMCLKSCNYQFLSLPSTFLKTLHCWRVVHKLSCTIDKMYEILHLKILFHLKTQIYSGTAISRFMPVTAALPQNNTILWSPGLHEILQTNMQKLRYCVKILTLILKYLLIMDFQILKVWAT